MRFFIAVELNDIVKGELLRVQAELDRIAKGGLRMMPPENLHITLKFIGELGTGQLDAVKAIIQTAILGAHPFKLKLASAGVFPPKGFPRVYWVGFECLDPIPGTLSKKLENEFEILGVEKETRQYTPHVTIARPGKGSVDGDMIRKRLTSFQIAQLEQEVHELTLFSSTLSQSGSRYEVVERFELG